MSALTAAARGFRAAHHGQRPLVLPNVWDCASARVFAGAGFGALATSSGAVAVTLGCAAFVMAGATTRAEWDGCASHHIQPSREGRHHGCRMGSWQRDSRATGYTRTWRSGGR